MAKKETSTKSFVLRVDAATMDAIEKWAADEFRTASVDYRWGVAEEWADEEVQESSSVWRESKGGLVITDSKS